MVKKVGQFLYSSLNYIQGDILSTKTNDVYSNNYLILKLLL